jgi:hypothetical protein
MAMTIDRIAALLDELDLGYQRQDQYLFVNMQTEIYRDPEKQDSKVLTLMIELLEDGEFFTLLAPRAYFVRGEHQDAFLRACARVQWRTKMVQFEWDASDGEVRPIIEIPLEDSELTARQLRRCIQGLCSIIDRYHEVLLRAATEGVVALPGDDPADGPAAGDGAAAGAGAVGAGPSAPDPGFVGRVKAVLAARRDGGDGATAGRTPGPAEGAAGTDDRPAGDDQGPGPPRML